MRPRSFLTSRLLTYRHRPGWCRRDRLVGRQDGLDRGFGSGGSQAVVAVIAGHRGPIAVACIDRAVVNIIDMNRQTDGEGCGACVLRPPTKQPHIPTVVEWLIGGN